MAVVWPIRCCPVGQGDPRSPDQQVQGVRFRHHDELRRGSGGYTDPQRIHPGQQSPPGLLQDQQVQDLRWMADLV